MRQGERDDESSRGSFGTAREGSIGAAEPGAATAIEPGAIRTGILDASRVQAETLMTRTSPEKGVVRCDGPIKTDRSRGTSVRPSRYRGQVTEVNREYRHAILAGVHFFNGVTAAGGGVALIVGLIPEVPQWVAHTDFTGNYFPGVILLAIVGGSALIAGVATVKRALGWQLASIVAGLIMVIWILGEIASIRAFHFLQVIYLVTGIAALWLTPRAAAR